MRSISLSLLLCVLSVAFPLASAQDRSLNEVAKAFDAADVPITLAIKFNPSALLQVTFPQANGRSVTLRAGVHLPRNATASPPSFSLQGSTKKDRCRGPFVIAAVDPDAPTPQDPSVAQVRHGLFANYYLSDRIDLKGALKNRTAAVTEWLQPSPPGYSDAHRYIFLLYQQPKDFNEQKLVTPDTSLIFFNVSAFASAVGLGDPVAGTFMIVSPDVVTPAPTSSSLPPTSSA